MRIRGVTRVKTSARGIELIKQFEGLELEAYQDIAGIWTIGYGHTGPDVEPGMRITEREAEALLRKDLTPRENAVDRLTSVELNQNEFDALVSFVYNVGIDAYRRSTARRRLNKGDRIGAADALTWWNKATVGGVLREVRGLTRRRAAERALFLTPTNPPIVREPDNLTDNSRVTPVEDSPRRGSLAESRTIQGATVAGGAGAAAATMGRDNAEELDQIESNIEAGTGLIEDESAAEGSTPPQSMVEDEETESPDTLDDGEIDAANDPDVQIPEEQTDAAGEDDEDAAADSEDAPPRDDEDDDVSDSEAAASDDDIVIETDEGDIIDHAHDDESDMEHGEIIMEGAPARPSKHEVHAVEAQIQFALLVLIVLAVLFIIFARIDDWRNFRR